MKFLAWKINFIAFSLTLFHLGGGGLFHSLYHESVSRIYRTRTRLTKFHDFVPFGICQDPAKLFLKFFSKNIEIFDVVIFWKKFFLKKNLNFEILNGLRVSHIKFQQNRRQKFFFVSKGGPFGVLVIFKVSQCIRLSTLTDINGQSDFHDCWNSGIKGCLNIKKIIWEQVLGAGVTFHWVIWLKTKAGQKDPPPGDNVIPEPRWDRVKSVTAL